MAKNQIKNYTFDASEKKVTFSDFGTIDLESIYAVINDTDGVTIFQKGSTTKGGGVSGNVLTTDFDTSSPLMADEDKLTILYDEGSVPTLSKSFEYNSGETTGNTALVAAGAAEKIRVIGYDMVCDKANPNDVGFILGFGTATLPLLVTGGVAGIVATHAGIAAGSGMTKHQTESDPILKGAVDEDLRLTAGDPGASGSFRVTIFYQIRTE